MTTEHVLRIPRSDLDLIRITCKHAGCGKTCEMSIRDARMTFQQGLCPFCLNPWAKNPGTLDTNPFVALLTAWQLFDGEKDQVDVEFVVPAPAK